jgi:hypothetical protein
MPTIRILYTFVLIGGLAPLSGVVGARTVYKWTDEQGRIHYGGQAPETGPMSTLQIKDAPRSAPAPTPRLRVTPTKPRPRKSPNGADQRRSAERLARRCAGYRKKLAYHTSKMRAGYTARQYNALEDKRRHYRRQLHRQCP